VQVDLIEPWRIDIGNETFVFNAFTAIDLVTNLFGLIRIENRSSAHVRDKFIQFWLARYPIPSRCVHDNGKKFIDFPTQVLLQQFGVKEVATTVKNPQRKSICERMHQTVANILQFLLHLHPPKNVQSAQSLVYNAFSTAMHATQCTVHRSLSNSPGALEFHIDMLMDVPLIADLLAIQNN